MGSQKNRKGVSIRGLLGGKNLLLTSAFSLRSASFSGEAIRGLPIQFRQSALEIDRHLQTLAATIPLGPEIPYKRSKLELEDGDFLVLDWLKGHCRQKLTILSHGLEGSSQSAYIRLLAKHLHEQGSDVLAWNLRSCGGILNRAPHAYHAGLSSDLEAVVSHVLAQEGYCDITLVGFSLGGNITLKFLGEQSGSISSRISRVIAVSAPCDLEDCALTLSQAFGGFYNNYLLKILCNKMENKAQNHPEIAALRAGARVKNFEDFDNVFTAPLFGFSNAREYWRTQSAKNFIPDIRVPTWIVSAYNDPFYTGASIPVKESQDNPFVRLVISRRGGHMGFYSGLRWNRWIDRFIANLIAEGQSLTLEELGEETALPVKSAL